MNETLNRWTFNFHKVVRQHNAGAVEDFILPYSAVYLRIQKWKNYWNRSTFAEGIVKIKVARFFMAHGVYIIMHEKHRHSNNISKTLWMTRCPSPALHVYLLNHSVRIFSILSIGLYGPSSPVVVASLAAHTKKFVTFPQLKTIKSRFEFLCMHAHIINL